ncbi:MAG TPA: SMC-Scp complex subunit ScpB [Calditrichia bacterium]|nr:SMC-Scp complex subunit ScpB [Calditrichia bacterium]
MSESPEKSDRVNPPSSEEKAPQSAENPEAAPPENPATPVPDPAVEAASAKDEAGEEAETGGDEDPAAEPGPDAPQLSDADYLQAAGIFEALLFSSEEPLSISRIREVMPEELRGADTRRIVRILNEAYQESGRAFELRAIAGGYQLFTRPEYSEYVGQLFSKRSQNRLSAKALETLAIIAYKQPVTRLEIEEVRGVSADGVLRTLLSRDLVSIAGQASTPGNPFLYKTSKAFLEYFGLKTIKDLPRLKELDEIVESDTDIKERFGEEFLKEITPELLGMKDPDSEDGEDEEFELEDGEQAEGDEENK